MYGKKHSKETIDKIAELNRKYTIEDAQKIAKERGGQCLSTDYKNVIDKLRWKCKNPDHPSWYATFSSINGGGWCRECAFDRMRLSLKDAQDLAKSKDGKCLSTKYKNSHTKMLWKCVKGHVWEATLDSIKNRSWCSECSDRKRLSIDDGKCLSTKYKNNKVPLLWECNVCSHKWKAALFDIKIGNTWCPKCAINNKSQKRLFDILQDIYPNFNIHYNYRGFDWLASKHNTKQEIDIFIEDIRLAIEYDGEQHFKPMRFGTKEEMLKKLKTIQARDRKKNKKIAENTEDVKCFIRIPYTEKIDKDNIIKILKNHNVLT